MSRYAENTSVSVDRSKAEIEKVLHRYGADQFLYGTSSDGALIGFRAHGRFVRFRLPLPDPKSHEYTRTPTGKARHPETANEAWEKGCRQRWRALCLVIKAKLEAVESEITDFETEFMGHLMLPDGRTAGEWFLPQLELAYETGQMPESLPGLPAPAGVKNPALIAEIVS